jgi:hypothetical protein
VGCFHSQREGNWYGYFVVFYASFAVLAMENSHPATAGVEKVSLSEEE